MNWERIGSIDRPKLTFENPKFEYMDNWENLCLNLGWTVEIRWGIHIKKEWPHFKLGIYD